MPLALKQVFYRIGERTLIHPINLELRAGTRTVIIGPNGAGKSLTLGLCHGLIRPSGGEVRWAQPAQGYGPKRHAMVFQRPVLLRRSALGNVTYALAIQGIPRTRRKALALKALEQTGLESLAEQPARVLSSGEQQRLALARAWALKPQVLFLDEPTANLDPAAILAVEKIIAGIFSSGTKIVMVTQDLGQARRLADEVIFLHKGHLLEHSAAKQFFSGPESSAARSFLQGDLVW